MSVAFEFDLGVATNRGRQRENEDWFGHYAPRDSRLLSAKGALFVVTDGLGGYAAGQVASRLGGNTIFHEYYRDPQSSIAKSLELAVQRANQQIYQQSQRDPSVQGMATTVVAAVLRGGELCIAHVGDSRAYLARGPQIRQLTRDHTWVADAVTRGELTAMQALRHPWRRIVTRALGRRAHVDVGLSRVRLEPGDVFLLCSDGMSDFVSGAEMWRILKQERPSRAASALADMAYRRGSDDNISALVVAVRPVAQSDVQRITPLPQFTLRRVTPNAVAMTDASWIPLLQLGLIIGTAIWAIFLAMALLGSGK